MGIVSKGSICDVEDCEEVAIRSLNTKKVQDAGLRVNSSGKKTVLCKKCYKDWKKATKDDRSLERARYDRG
tara:strand:- start:393 stop:605 length:213 start_codon:yes stop_codon:yes gene_type:complete